MKRHLIIALTLAAFGLATLAPAAAKSVSPRASANHAKKHVVHTSQAGGQIACTSLGCRPIPSNCTPRPGMRPNGNPTGYDVIVCP